MHGQHLNTCLLGNLCDGHAIAPVGGDTRADFQGDRHGHGGDHCIEDGRYLLFVGQQGGARSLPAHLFGGASHVDVDDVGAVIHVSARGLCQLPGFAAHNLNRTNAFPGALAPAQR